MKPNQDSQAIDSQILVLQKLLSKLPDPAVLQYVGEATWQVLRHEHKELVADLLVKDIAPKWQATKDVASELKTVGSNLGKYFRKFKQQAEVSGIDSAFSSLSGDITEKASKAKDKIVQSIQDTPDALSRMRSSVITFSDQLVVNYQSLENDAEKGQYLLKLALFASLLGVSFYYGHELPDSDFKLWGPGAHRSFISHSALPFLTIKAASTVILRTLERAQTHLKDHPEALSLNEELQQCLKLVVFGLGAGITTHLLVDGLVQTGGTIRIHDLNGKTLGSLISGTRIDDMAYTTLMGLFSGYETQKIAAG